MIFKVAIAGSIEDSDVGSRARRQSRIGWAFLPFLAFALMTILTWRRWVLPFQDSGREMFTPARLAAGEVLYRDVGSPYGPLPAYLDAFALRVFGKDLDTLIALRLVIALLGVEALRRLAGRLVRDPASASAVATFVAVACLFGNGGNWPFPYSVAALEGTVGCWWALELALSSGGRRRTCLAVLVAGLAAGTKLEMLPAAMVAVLPALLLLRPKREAFAAGGVVALLGTTAFAAPVLAFGVEHMHRYGFLIAFPVPEAWRQMYRQGVLFAGTSPHEFFGGGFVHLWLPSLLFFGAGVALCSVRIAPPLRLAALAALVALVLVRLGGNAEIAALVPMVGMLAVVEAAAVWRERPSPDPARVAGFCMAAVALVAASRQPFFLRNMIYGAFSAPLALGVSLAILARHARSRRSFALFLVGLAGVHAFQKWRDDRMHPVERLEVPGLRLNLPAGEARLVRLSVDLIRRSTAPGSYVAAFPDPGVLLFATGRRSPFIDDVFYPGLQDAAGEDAMIRRLRDRSVSMILVTNRDFSEYGRARYGKGVLDRFFGEVDRSYRPVEILGADPAETWRERHATKAVVFRPRTDGDLAH